MTGRSISHHQRFVIEREKKKHTSTHSGKKWQARMLGAAGNIRGLGQTTCAKEGRTRRSDLVRFDRCSWFRGGNGAAAPLRKIFARGSCSIFKALNDWLLNLMFFGPFDWSSQHLRISIYECLLIFLDQSQGLDDNSGPSTATSSELASLVQWVAGRPVDWSTDWLSIRIGVSIGYYTSPPPPPLCVAVFFPWFNIEVERQRERE